MGQAERDAHIATVHQHVGQRAAWPDHRRGEPALGVAAQCRGELTGRLAPDPPCDGIVGTVRISAVARQLLALEPMR
jgi:hypothetical protein